MNLTPTPFNRTTIEKMDRQERGSSRVMHENNGRRRGGLVVPMVFIVDATLVVPAATVVKGVTTTVVDANGFRKEVRLGSWQNPTEGIADWYSVWNYHISTRSITRDHWA
ncbi:hypothetical protein ACJRO7_014578 [Eucalyptus globulus]|uniref:Uncharacterized protein n=1 Tax=Eucalyptus globulus TaxID=34317 RepID=A0ABD3L6L8_EUCGL